MTKPQITRIWLIGVIVMIVGLIVAGISMGMMFVNGGTYVLTTNGYEFIPRLDSYFWTTVSFMIVGGVIAIAGGITQLVAWIGALVNTYQLPEKTWFAVLLGGGIVGLAFGLAQFAVMIAYIIAGPDSRGVEQPRYPTQAPPQAPPQPTTWAPS